ncbi:MAG: hypothetical protein WCO11_00425 [Sphingomonadales bacterium]
MNDRSDRYDTPRSRDGAGRTIAIIALVAVVLLAIAWAAGLFNVDTKGSLTAPKVSVKGGSVPKVDVNTADIKVGTRKETIEVPTVNIEKPKDDGKPS